MQIHDVTAKGVPKPTRKRVGRGQGSGNGGTAGRGHKGQRSRSGDSSRPGFEGGQMPLYRLVPKRGFNNARYRKHFTVVNVGLLAGFPAGATIGLDEVLQAGMSRRTGKMLKVLGEGDLPHALTVKAHKFSASAKQKIESAGGTAEVIG